LSSIVFWPHVKCTSPFSFPGVLPSSFRESLMSDSFTDRCSDCAVLFFLGADLSTPPFSCRFFTFCFFFCCFNWLIYFHDSSITVSFPKPTIPFFLVEKLCLCFLCVYLPSSSIPLSSLVFVPTLIRSFLSVGDTRLFQVFFCPVRCAVSPFSARKRPPFLPAAHEVMLFPSSLEGGSLAHSSTARDLSLPRNLRCDSQACALSQVPAARTCAPRAGKIRSRKAIRS